MKLVQTLVVRDEVDIVDTQIRYHLDAGVDLVIATDHDSTDGTTEVLEAHERDGHLRLIREQGPFRESAWRTGMARLAATEHDADWVFNTDADEFWMPRGGTLKEVFDAIPLEFGIVWALTRHFVVCPDDDRPFYERMTVRLSATAPINDPTSPFRPHAKVAHRGVSDVTVGYGAHLAFAPSLRPLRDWYPFDVFHFPFRTEGQYRRKGIRGETDNKPLGQYVKARLASDTGRLDSVFDSMVVDDDALARGLGVGALALDTRLRDAVDGRHPSQPNASERSAAVAEGAALRDADLVRVRRRLDQLDSRVAHVEGGAHSGRRGRTGAR
jgi:hypothetical protein